MTHPFETELSKLKTIDFDLEENISDDQLEKLHGGKYASTRARGEEGGSPCRPKKLLTTLALGEEGGIQPCRPVI